MTEGVNHALNTHYRNNDNAPTVTIAVSLPFRGRWHAKRDGGGDTNKTIGN